MALVSREIIRENRDAVASGALVLKRAIEDERDRATGGDGVLSGVGRGGTKLGVGFDIRGVRNPTALVRARGPWQFVQNRIGVHVITPRRSQARRNLNAAGRVIGGAGRSGGRVGERVGSLSGLGSGRGRGRRAILIGGAIPRAYARHPGIPASAQPKPWNKGVDKGASDASEAMATDFVQAARRAFRF